VIDLITEPHWFAHTMLMAHISVTRQQIFFFTVLDKEEGEVDVLLGVIVIEGLVAKFLCVEGIVIGAGAVKVQPVVLGGLMAVDTGLGLSNASLVVVDAPLAGLDAGGVDRVEAGIKDLHVDVAIALEFLCVGGAELASTTCCHCCRWWYHLFLFLYFGSLEMHIQHLPDLRFVMCHLQWMHVHESRLLAAAQLAVVIMVIFCRRMRGTHV